MPRGGKRPGAGRPKGSPNRITREVRAAIKELVELNVPRLDAWFQRAWKSDDDGKVAANLLSRLIEYAAPKLSRADPVLGERALTVQDLTDADLESIAGEDAPLTDDDAYLMAEIRVEAQKMLDKRHTPREATAADFGLEERAPRALPAPVREPLLALPASAPMPAREPIGAAPAVPAAMGVEIPIGDGATLMPRSPAEERREAERQAAAAQKASAERRAAMMERRSRMLAEQEAEESEAREKIRAKLGDPHWHEMSRRQLGLPDAKPIPSLLTADLSGL